MARTMPPSSIDTTAPSGSPDFITILHCHAVVVRKGNPRAMRGNRFGFLTNRYVVRQMPTEPIEGRVTTRRKTGRLAQARSTDLNRRPLIVLPQRERYGIPTRSFCRLELRRVRRRARVRAGDDLVGRALA